MEIEKTPIQKKLDELLAKEKTARMDNNQTESINVLKQIVQVAYDLGEFKVLFEQVEALAKKRGQSKKAQIEMVQLCMQLLSKIDDKNTKIEFVEAIKRVCDKKIYLEVEYARCCLMLVKHKESAQNIDEAAKILQEVQVETYGSMDKREKLEFILYQMNIMIKKKDYVRLLVISRKIKHNNLEDATISDLKISYFSYLVEYHNHEGNFLEAAKSYQRIWETLHKYPELQTSLPKRIDFDFNIEYKNVLENFVLYLAISPYSLEKNTLLNSLLSNHLSVLESQPRILNIVKEVLKEELISTDVSSYQVSDVLLFQRTTEHHETHFKQFRKILIQHNILVVQKYYKRIELTRLSGLLKIDDESAESELCQMINDKMVFCKIDRIDGVINFQLKRTENEVINSWNTDIDKLLLLIDQTSNLIKREEEKYQ